MEDGQAVFNNSHVARTGLGRLSIFGGTNSAHQRLRTYVASVIKSGELQWKTLVRNGEVSTVNGNQRDGGDDGDIDKNTDEKEDKKSSRAGHRRASASTSRKRNSEMGGGLLSSESDNDRVLYIHGLDTSSLFLIRIREKNAFGWGEWGEPTPLLTEPFKLSYVRKGKCKFADNRTTIINSTGESCLIRLGDVINITKDRQCFARNHKNSKHPHHLRGLMLECKFKFAWYDTGETNKSSTVQFALGWCPKSYVNIVKPYLTTMCADQYVKPNDFKGAVFCNSGMIWKDITPIETLHYQNRGGLWKQNDSVSMKLNTLSKTVEFTFPRGWFRGQKVKTSDINSNDFTLFLWMSHNTKVTISEQKSEFKVDEDFKEE
ncbi:hypothetical protein RFI_26454 [Reticulomyxa filosa]|uniref:Uncharacterized protein n=1 Tax=Reticulomyxa filosa TaxID=46433 RepID=X6MBA3_RETFI|nr:hypothetical protein RFI_26454 [Reticulomyxa filosa]|eukprot:ETO10926.1 hypothetical protein RFI_26454 [Reticulomyxa filosa]